jgi:hypothetical protein
VCRYMSDRIRIWDEMTVYYMMTHYTPTGTTCHHREVCGHSDRLLWIHPRSRCLLSLFGMHRNLITRKLAQT